MSTLPELDVNRVAFDGEDEVDGSREIREALFFGNPDTVFEKGVVTEVITDPAGFKNQLDFEKKYNESTIINFMFIPRVTRNCILVRPLNDGQGVRTNKVQIALPFFPPHICFPVKPGEHVWLVKPTPTGTDPSFVHWISRVPCWDDVEDLNYSHEPRRNHFQSGEESEPDPAQEANDTPPPKEENADSFEMFGFPNGTGTDGGFTFGTTANEYCSHSTGSLAYHSFKYEPVPRLSKRPADMVLQGSNNTSIILGTTGNAIPGGWAESADEQDRIDALALGPAGEPPSQSISTVPEVDTFTADPEADPPRDFDAIREITEAFAPAIDIIAGRGYRIRDEGLDHDFEDQEKLPLERDGDINHPPTYPRVKATADDNGRGMLLSETSKNPASFMPDMTDSAFDHAIEGDPDFRYDAARVYVAADGNPDVDFGLAETSGEKVKLSENNEVDAQKGSNVVLKADHIRIIARKDPDGGVANPVVGSIRIVKEGGATEATTDARELENTRAVISIEPDGTIYIDGPKIVIGGREFSSGSPKSEGRGDQVFLGEDATESVVLGDILLAKLQALEDAFNAHVHNSGAGPTTMHHATGGGAGVESAEFTTTPAVPPDADGDSPGQLILSKIAKVK